MCEALRSIPGSRALEDMVVPNENNGSSTRPCPDENEKGDQVQVPLQPVFNGNTFSGRNIYVPPELLELILSYCDTTSLIRLSEVCQTWYQIFHTEYFWYCVMKNRGLEKEWAPACKHLNNHPDSWQVYFSIVKFNFLNRNLVRNPSGEEGFENWTIMSGESGGWTVETVADYQNIVPSLLPQTNDGSSCCFATNQFSCSKEQNIDLWSLGLTPPVIRACIPFMLTWSDLVTTPVGHSGIYEARVSFLDTDLGPFISPYSRYDHKVRTTLGNGTPWKLISRTFVITPKNAHEVIEDLRYFYIYHGAMNTSEAEGHFGPKISRTSLKVSLINA